MLKQAINNKLAESQDTSWK